MFLQSERLAFRAPERGDADLYVRWLNDPAVYPYLMRDRPLSRVEEEAWLSNAGGRPDDAVFLIELREGSRPIGGCGLHGVRSPSRAAELGIFIGEADCRERGLGREAMELLCYYGFRMLNLNRIGLRVYEYNPRAIRCYERAGFRVEGRRREARYWNGRYWDVVVMGRLAAEGRVERPEPAAALCQT